MSSPLGSASKPELCDSLLGVLGFDRHPDRPDEPEQLSGDGRDDLLLALAAAQQPPVALMQAVLRLPRDRLDRLTERRMPSAERSANPRLVAIRPGCLDDDPAQMRVPGLR